MRRLTALAAAIVCAALTAPTMAQTGDPLADPPVAEPTGDPAPPPEAADHGFPTGFYFAIGLGGGVVTESESGTVLERRGGCTAAPAGALPMWYEPDDFLCVMAPNKEFYDDVVHTDFGGGLGVQLKLGYNILGFASVEASVSGAGNPNGSSGLGSVAFQLHWHIANHIQPFTERKWDFSAFGGFGYAIGGYHEKRTDPTDPDGEGKGWEGMAGTVGGTFEYALAKRVTVGLDLKAVIPLWKTWIANFDNDYRATPAESPTHVVFLPTLMFNFYLE